MFANITINQIMLCSVAVREMKMTHNAVILVVFMTQMDDQMCNVLCIYKSPGSRFTNKD